MRINLPRAVGLASGVVALGLWAAGAAGQTCNGAWLPGAGVRGVSSNPVALASWDPDGAGSQEPRLVVGGTLSAAGSAVVDDVALWDGATWRATADAGICSALLAVGTDLYSGGSGSGIGVSQWNGTSWQALSSPFGASGAIEALGTFNGRLIAAGQVTLFLPPSTFLPVNIVQRINNTWESVGTGVNGIVWALTVYNGELIAAGEFTQAGGAPASRIARWDGTAWRALGSGIVGTRVISLAVHDNQLIVGGLFNQAGGINARNIARWNGTAWSAMGTTFDNQVEALTVHNGELFAGGSFSGPQGFASQNVFRWNGTAFVPLPVGVDGSVSQLISHRGQLVVAGLFSAAGETPAQNIAAWNGSAWSAFGTGSAAAGARATRLIEYRGQTVVGGVFAALGATAANSVASYDGASFSPFGTGLQDDRGWGRVPGSLIDAAVFNNELIVFGGFVRAGSATVNNGQAKWNGTAWSALTAPGTLTGVPTALLVFNNQLVGAGTSYDANFNATSRVMTFAGGRWSPLGGVFASSLGFVSFARLGIYNGQLIVAGSFDTVNGQTVNNIARWDGTAWRSLGSGITGTPFLTSVGGLTVFANELVASGRFTNAGGVAVNGIARWNGTNWQPVGFGIEALSPATAVYRGNLVAYLRFSNFTQSLARWDGVTWTPFGGQIDGVPFGMIAVGDELRIAGTFTRVGGQVSAYFARWTDTGVPLVAVAPASQSVESGQTVVLSATPAAGYANVSVQWLRNGVAITNGSGGASPGGGTVTGATGTLASPTDGSPAVLRITGVQASDAGDFAAVFTNACGNVTTTAATVTVTGGCPGDFNNNGSVDFFDYLDFVQAFADEDPSADFNGNGTIDFFDYLDFVQAFDAGC